MLFNLFDRSRKYRHLQQCRQVLQRIDVRQMFRHGVGNCSLRTQTRWLLLLLLVALSVMLLSMWLSVRHYIFSGLKVQLVGELVMQSQRIGKAMPNAIQGSPAAFGQLTESRERFALGIDLLMHGGIYQQYLLDAPDAGTLMLFNEVASMWSRADQAALAILQLQPELTGFGVALVRLCQLVRPMQDLSEQILTLQSGKGSVKQKVAAAKLVRLTLHLGHCANALPAMVTVDPDVAPVLGKDVTDLRDAIANYPAGHGGSGGRGLQLKYRQQIHEKLRELERIFGDYEPLASGLLGNFQNFVAVKQVAQLVIAENELLMQQLSILQDHYRAMQAARSWPFWIALLSMMAALLSAIGIARLQLADSRRHVAEADARRQDAETQRQQAQQQEVRAIRTNADNQEAILRLMDELQKVADGDLTVHTTVTDDIAGAIAASVNYTVAALRGLVGQVTHTAAQVASASSQVKQDAEELIQAGQIQARRIHDTGQSMLKMSLHSTDVSISANKSADVARHSVVVAERGARAVEDAVKGMNEIREQIQETSKRIKRLGVSSQEIGEITELISDITEQTNVLALNAAIQAASAGEAGRGFSVVAEEVQRLAERSSAATRQIGALVRMIQDDTYDAAAAMEKSTAGVVEGARLSDAAGVSLADIRRVSNQLAELIQHISSSAGHQATLANSVAQDIQNILNESEIIEARREQALTLFTELSEQAELLKNSASCFRVTLGDTPSSRTS